MKVEDAVKILDNMRFDITTKRNKEVVSAMAINIAIGALQKHIPKEPFWEGDGYADGAMVYDVWRCPNCDRGYEEDEVYHYCPNCGQKILWYEENND